MLAGLWIKFGWMAFVAAAGLGFLIFGWRSGMFRNAEEPKYRMLEDREPAPWGKDEGDAP